jgi:hypothetical protein
MVDFTMLAGSKTSKPPQQQTLPATQQQSRSHI